ncbi:MAG: ATP-binding protein, partial [Oscillospiraceae bacterium]|nr:ATP-binding protein [Oscillospiraceae bacterium]
NIHSAFVTARTKRPCVLFFDEIDALGYSRSKMHSDSMRPVVDQLLAEIEGVDSDNQRVLIIGATNTPWDVDPALRRPGRFDQSLFVPPPDAKARETIFKLKLMGRPIGPMNYNAFASMTQLHSGADIENIVETAAENVLEEIMKTGNRERRIESVDVENVISATRPSTIEWLRTVANYTKYANQSGFYDEVEQYMRENKRYF